jgi:hypothetical protein
MKRTLAFAMQTLLLIAAPVHARLTEIRIVEAAPFAPGTTYGDAGAYERVKGTFKGELDPADARNRVIANLDLAPRTARGRVEYEADFFILRPADPAKGRRKILYDVVNRGRLFVQLRLQDAKPASAAAANDPRTAQDAGNGFLLRRGYTVVWSGWDPDAPHSNNRLTMKPVIATENGKTIVRTIREALDTGPPSPLRDTLRLTHESPTLDTAQATLTVRRKETDERRAIPADGWRFVGSREIALLPAGTKPEPGSLYELHFPARNPRVLGIGMAATRDLVAYLRSGAPDDAGHANPVAPGTRAVLAFGISQSGRFLRDFVRDGYNQDEAGRKVFDGVLAHTAGVGGVFLNETFGQPARTGTQHEDHTFPENAFPFSTAHMKDPVTGREAGVLRNDGFDPLWMETNTSTEYWQKGASLLVTDPLGARDVAHPGNARGYLIAGTQHGGQAYTPSTPGECVNPRNPHSPMPALRALLVALDAWIDGTPPPDSRTPHLADGTFTRPEALAFPAIPGITVARRMNEFGVLRDWVRPDMDMSQRYRVYVTQVDADGNETAGVRLPDIDVPLATYTGWNLYKAPFPEGELCDRFGTYAPFAKTAAEGHAAHDPRPSLEERYGSHAEYVRRIAASAQQLVAARLLLQEDADRYVAYATSAEVAKRFAR